jgi:hypothetical protein
MSEKLEWNNEDESWFQDMKAEKEYYDGLAIANSEYRSNWPNYCTQCSGWGFTSWTEYGQQFVEECPCVWTKCPRCGNSEPTAQLVEELHSDEVYTKLCSKCGFRLHTTEGLQ